ncbi:MAG TPA: methyltransferase domain-containing protein [Gemmatimonadales bacterium]
MSRLARSQTGTEILDDPGADPRAVGLSLENIARSNRWFGGLAAVRYGLERLLAGLRGRITLLDIGTGKGDIPLWARRWAGSRDLELFPIGLDRHPVAARLAARHGVSTILGCGGDLPVRSRGVDIVVVSQVAHHLDPTSCVTLFHECNRVARVGVVLADLRRSRPAAAGFWIGSRLLGFDPVTRADGLTSLRRGFTAAELAALLRQSGIETPVVRRPGARLVAAWRTGR